MSIESPAQGAEAVTPSDTDELTSVRGILIAGSGTLRVTLHAGDTIDFADGELSKGVIHPMRVRKVHSTGTTLTKIWVFY